MAEAVAARPAGLPTVERKILFYRAVAGYDEAGQPVALDLLPALQYVNSLPWDEGRYWRSAGGPLTAVWIDRAAGDRCRARVANVRRSGLPAVEQAGRLTPLAIPDDSGIVEQTHLVFFRGNIVGAEFNFFGPRPTRMASYLLAKAPAQCPALTFEILVLPDVAERLGRFQDIRLLDLKVRPSFAEIIAEADQDLGHCFQAAARAAQAGEVQVILRPAARSGHALNHGLLAVVRHLFRHRKCPQEVTRFVVKGLDRQTRRVEELDLLNENLVVKKQVALKSTRFRAVDSASAYQAIEQAYDELADKLARAAGIAP